MSIQDEYSGEIFWDVQLYLSANNNSSWKKRTMIQTESIVEFFGDKNLFKKDISKRHATNPEELLIKIGKLTEDVFEFTEEYFDKWLNNTDRWKTEPTKEKYIKNLQKLYDKFKQ